MFISFSSSDAWASCWGFEPEQISCDSPLLMAFSFRSFTSSDDGGASHLECLRENAGSSLWESYGQTFADSKAQLAFALPQTVSLGFKMPHDRFSSHGGIREGGDATAGVSEVKYRKLDHMTEYLPNYFIISGPYSCWWTRNQLLFNHCKERIIYFYYFKSDRKLVKTCFQTY